MTEFWSRILEGEIDFRTVVETTGEVVVDTLCGLASRGIIRAARVGSSLTPAGLAINGVVLITCLPAGQEAVSYVIDELWSPEGDCTVVYPPPSPLLLTGIGAAPYYDCSGNPNTPPALFASFSDVPSTHNGSSSLLTFRLHFSEEFPLSYVTLRDHAFVVAGGTVTGARRVGDGINTNWEITVRPASDGAVTIALPAATDCADEAAICTEDGRTAFFELEVTIEGPQG
ncbi:hypothetical protein [Candidatus Poriferisodalis sp.]|uniref:hypothetical protein n=1 Tax=Candidatus Poriferisodalis sp. TaxID=3101277 RepID=UPI003D12948F